MAESFFSPSWYRVAKLAPRIRRHAEIHRHDYGGELWYVLQDHATGKVYRFTPIVHHVIGLMDGTRTVQEIWEKAVERYGDDAPSQGDIVRVLSQLHSADVLVSDVPPDTAELFRRAEKSQQSTWKMNLRSPLSLRLPLLDPETFLSRTIHIVRPLFSVAGGLLWLLVVGTAVLLASEHWSELTENITDHVLSVQNLLLIWLIYPVVKSLHELGHGYAVKRWGGEVHEIGIMLLVLMPVPYVDASSASAFRSKQQRMLVGAAGMMIELFVASLALFLWLAVEPGAVRAVTFNIILIAGVSTVLFNINPLLRYDGYYIFSDLVEFPNLAQRANEYLGHLIKRHLFGVKEDVPPYATPGKRWWLVTYAVTSFLYRILIYVSIIRFISSKFFIIGVLLGIWALASMVVIPAAKKLHLLFFGAALREKRARALAVTGAAALAVLIATVLVPFPLWTRSEGIIWVPEESLVRAGSDGFVGHVVARHAAPVRKGEVVVECEDPLLRSSVDVMRAQLGELRARYDAEILTNRAEAKIVAEGISHAAANLARAEERAAELTIRSPASGILLLPGKDDLPGRFLTQGSLVAYVLDADRPTVRVVVSQSAVDLIRKRTKSVEVRIADRLGQVLSAVLQREIPGAVERLPSPVLGSMGGGAVAVDPSDKNGTKTLEKMFQFDILLDAAVDRVDVGQRVYVRFDHGYEPLVVRWYRDLRRLFLRQFNV